MSIRSSPVPKWLTQVAFALAPIPAYLPQYWTFCSTSNDPVLKRNVPKRFNRTTSRSQLPQEQQQQQTHQHYDSHCGTGDRDSDKKQSQLSYDGQILVSTSNNSTSNNNLTNLTTSTNQISKASSDDSEGGFSTTSILILLLSHTFRLVYFGGCAIEQIFNQDNQDRSHLPSDVPVIIPKQAEEEERMEIDKIQYDLVLQSLTMIGIQYLLLSAVTRRKRVFNKRKSNKEDDSKDTISLLPGNSKPRSVSVSEDYDSSQQQYHHQQQQQSYSPHQNFSPSFSTATTTAEKRSNISQKPFVWLYKPSQFFRWHTSRQYIELLIFITFLTLTVCHRYIYPTDGYACVIFVRNLSVLLESCLALPQMMLNYKKKDTNGLSLIMIGGWIAGDLMKLVYFMPHRSVTDDIEYQPSPGNTTGQSVFICGSIFALVMDLLVGIQSWYWFPTHEVIEWKDSIKRRWRRFKSSIIAPIGWSIRRGLCYAKNWSIRHLIVRSYAYAKNDNKLNKQRRASISGNTGHCC